MGIFLHHPKKNIKFFYWSLFGEEVPPRITICPIETPLPVFGVETKHCHGLVAPQRRIVIIRARF
jgi:hypothetical protein